jgi:tyrosyl-DNA phosphodiesterase 2
MFLIQLKQRIMDALIQDSITKARADAKSTVAWKHDAPFHQSYHRFQDDRWTATEPKAKTNEQSQCLSNIVLYSWNIDFMLPYADSRMRLALRHLESLVNAQPNTTATIIYLQECLVSDLQLLASSPWIRQTFHLTDLSSANWTSGYYGTVTLIDRRLSISSCFRIHYAQTRMERDAFFTDIQLNAKTLRFCNSHLESLALDPPLRPAQVAVAAEFLKSPDVFGSAMAGDFNAIQPFDRTLHAENGLKDAYLELGGKEDDDAGFTWGQQAATKLREMFGCSRMDKVFFTGGLKLVSFERFGAGIELEDGGERESVVGLGFERAWITDHLGVVARFEVEDGEGKDGREKR